MIVFANGSLDQVDTSGLSDLEKDILEKKQGSPVEYYYGSPEALTFELAMRSAIVKAAKALYAGGADFATFANTRGNRRLWSRTDKGGLLLRQGVAPSEGINDIFRNGHLYAFECATAMVIVVYKAILDVIGKEIFDAYFANLLLYDWHYDSDLEFVNSNNLSEAYPGDILYFRNPDHDPEKPEWQGENAIMLGDDLFFGHGLGVQSSSQIIAALNEERTPGSSVSAYLTNEVVHPDFEHLRNLSQGRMYRAALIPSSGGTIIARIGTTVYIYEKKFS